MKITFNINYHTNWGESIWLYGSIPELGFNDPSKSVEMTLIGPDTWQYELELPGVTDDFEYSFVMKAPEKEWRFEWGAPHKFVAGKGIDRYSLFDSWKDMPTDKPFYSSAFVNGILRRECRDLPLKALPGTLCLRIDAPMIMPWQVLAVAGEGKILGDWNPQKALRMNDAHFPTWELNIPLEALKVPFEYKFVIINKETGEAEGWEYTNNRIYGIVQDSPYENIVVEGLRFANPNNLWKGAGTAIPVFSIRTEEDFGVGDFIDMKKMIDWCARTGQKVLQILPINDTILTKTWVDSYPYRSNSIYALHPLYIRLEETGTLKDPEKRKYYKDLAAELNELAEIDYERVMEAKMSYLKDIFEENGDETLESEDFKKFMRDNRLWIRPYAAWSVLRDINNTPDNSKWGEYTYYTDEKIEKLAREHGPEMDFYCFIQYHLDRQLRKVRDYAHQNGVVLKGDIPIGISRFSVDAWQTPQLFNMNCQAGAPPDDFSVLGQNWGFPTYNWDEMAKDGFAWWKNRFRKMTDYFDAYRIDHILGFFRIWQIPLDALHGLLGYFNPALPFSPEELKNSYDFWIDPEIQTKPLILDWMLHDFFGEYTEEVKEKYLDHLINGRYRLKPYVDTQLKIADLFAGLEHNEKNTQICNALMGLVDDVLFIEDPYQKGHYHPRISAQFTYQYRILTDYEKWCFNRLYNDFFYHRHNGFWEGKALWKLPPVLDSTSMLTCAEDLGMIPDCVPYVMNKLEILSLEIQRMPKDPKLEFGDTWNYPYYSVCTTSTHDMAGIRGWWEENREISQRFYNIALHENGEAPYYAEPWICRKILDLQLASPSMFCIIPLQDWLSADGSLRREKPAEEVINEPANPRHYWRYRMHLTVEELLRQDRFNDEFLAHVKQFGR